MHPLMPRSLIVLLGFHNLSNSLEIGRVPYAVQGIHVHPDWNPYTTSYDADIAVLMLYRDVQFNEHIQPICMTSTNKRVAASTRGVIVGNGKGGHENEYENIPKILKMPIQTDQNCTDKDYTFRDLLTGRAFCAGSGNGQGVCTGDSGSGFVVSIGNVFYLRGIVSASLGNPILGCDVDSYSVFTNALKFIDWVNAI
jgi:secreted trypsin-like serine protease